jgi:hypothetical protein
MADPNTEELRVEQVRRELEEHDRARAADEPDEQRQHARRADKAGYLRDKLTERTQAERRAEEERT